MKRLGLLGGTFNPVHFGHLAMAQLAIERVSLDKVVFIPTNIPPHKSPRSLASSRDRFNMVKLAIQGNPRFQTSDFEIKKGGKSYSIDTITYFHEKYPKTKLFFIIGEDAAWHLGQWKGIREIRKIVSFVVVNRPGYINKGGRSAGHFYVEMPAIDIASSFLRKRVLEGKSIDYFVPKSVAAYIRKKGLYKKV